MGKPPFAQENFAAARFVGLFPPGDRAIDPIGRPGFEVARGCLSMAIEAGVDESVYPIVKVAAVVAALEAEGISRDDALKGVHLPPNALSSPAARVSINQVITCYRNAIRLTRDRFFAYRAGLRFHVSTYGMYGFAILSSASFHQTMQFALKYHELATPLVELAFRQDANNATWIVEPIAHPAIDAALYRFLTEMQFGIHVSLHRDVMGASFAPRQFHLTYDQPDASETYPPGCDWPVLFGQSENRFVFDPALLDARADFGNEITYSMVVRLCDQLMDELQLRTGIAGKVREALLVNLARPTSFEAVARHLKMSTRTLRRKLSEENTSFRALLDDLRMQVAIKYLRDTNLTIEAIAAALGFSDAANFRHAFRRWTGRPPQEFRNHSRV
jgi:AraC-like DNA-binding protein